MKTTEQRRAPRTRLDATIEVVDIESGIEFRAETIDTCSAGLSFRAPMEPAMGAELEVTLEGQPRAAFKVLRISPSDEGFDVAGELKPRWS